MKQKPQFTSVMFAVFFKKRTRQKKTLQASRPHTKQSQSEPDVENTRLPGATKRLPVERYVTKTREVRLTPVLPSPRNWDTLILFPRVVLRVRGFK